MKREQIEKILSCYEESYSDQTGFYHSFSHARWVVYKGIQIIQQINFSKDWSERLQNIFVHAMAAHDARHLNGREANDRENVDRALAVFRPYNLGIDDEIIARKIIDGTCTPYLPIRDLFLPWETINPSKDQSNLHIGLLLQIARDVDTLGIIGISNKKERERALVGLMKEFLQKKTPEQLSQVVIDRTEEFFNGIQFSTTYGKSWAKHFLKERREWQLGFIQEAINRAATE